MTEQDVVLIHGTWGHGGEWDDFGADLSAKGYRVHAPSWRHHGRPGEVGIWSNAERIAKLGLLDYVSDLQTLVETLETPPIIVGHSVGGLLAQLLAARVDHKGAVLLAPAPAAGISTFYLSSFLLWGGYVPTWIRGRPMFPVAKKRWDKYVCNSTAPELSTEFYDGLCAESGTAYRQMIFWFLDPKRSSKVDFDAVGPVLTIAGSEDKCTPPGMCRATHRRYGSRGTYVEIAGSDHMLIAGTPMSQTLAAIEEWVEVNQLR